MGDFLAGSRYGARYLAILGSPDEKRTSEDWDRA